MNGLDFSGLSTVCATCDSDIDFLDESELGICRQCGEAFLFDELDTPARGYAPASGRYPQITG